MPSFLEKLKKGMGMEVDLEKAETKEAPKSVKKQKKPRSIEIKTEKLELAEPNGSSHALANASVPAEPKNEVVKQAQAKKDKWFEPEGQLAIDVYETDGELVIQSAIAGVKPEDLYISIENDRVSIRGERQDQTKKEGKNYFHQECYWGAFSREIILPVETDPSRAEASMRQGVLTIRIPKIERQKKIKIEIKS